MPISLKGTTSGGIKSIQRGLTSVNASSTLNITVSEVVMSRSLLIFDKHQIIGGGSTASTGGAVGSLTSSTNISVVNNSAAGSVLFAWQLLEYN